jgi:hypothetical protein
MRLRSFTAQSRRRPAALLKVAGVVGAVLVACRPSPPRAASSVVRQVDHILVVSVEADVLFSLLSDTFQLPVAWPMTTYGGFASGGVAFGNVNLEVVRSSRPREGIGKSRWTGFALEPEPLRGSLAELDARGIRHGKAAPFRSRRPDGSLATRWTTVALPEVSSDAVEIFLCQFEDDLPERRRRWQEQLQSIGGGPLSIQSVREIVYGAKDVEGMRANWQKLLAPEQASSEGVWALGKGPAIRLVQADLDGIRELVVQVRSLKQAREFLMRNGLMGTDRPNALTLAGSSLQELEITLIEVP